MHIDLLVNPSGAAALIYDGDDELASIRRTSSGALLMSFLSGNALELPIAPELTPLLENARNMQVVKLEADGKKRTDIYIIAGNDAQPTT